MLPPVVALVALEVLLVLLVALEVALVALEVVFEDVPPVVPGLVAPLVVAPPVVSWLEVPVEPPVITSSPPPPPSSPPHPRHSETLNHTTQHARDHLRSPNRVAPGSTHEGLLNAQPAPSPNIGRAEDEHKSKNRSGALETCSRAPDRGVGVGCNTNSC